jgi:hypothetical protein
VAPTGEELRFEQPSAVLGRWFDVKAYSPARGYFGVIFKDVTAQVEARATVERLASERQQALDALREESRLRERFMDILGLAGRGVPIPRRRGKATVQRCAACQKALVAGPGRGLPT